MGKIAEDMVDGTMCSLCGCLFRDKTKCIGEQLFSHEYSVVCWDCWRDLDEQQKEANVKALVETF